MLKVSHYAPDSDLTIMNLFYKYQDKDPSGKRTKDYATLIYKDNKTGRKYHQTFYEPKYTYYLAKPEIQIEDYNMHFIEIEKTNPVTCKWNEIYKSIAEETGNLDLFKDNIKSGNYMANRLFLTHPRVFGADMPILNYMRSEFNSTYQNPVCPITIGFFDTEADGINADSDDLVIGRDPTIMISMFFTGTNTMYSFIRRDSNNPLIEELEIGLQNDFESYKQKFKDYIKFDLGSNEKIKKYGLSNINLSVGFFDTELDMILSFFEHVKKLSPDFLLAWNMGYDMPQLIARLQVNGVIPATVICDQDFENKFCNYIVDERNRNEPEERCDFAEIASYTTYLDQMILYASRRKGQSAVSSFSLDNIGTIECGVQKLDYHDITTNITKFPYLDFERFWIYNLIDVVVQVCIEMQTGDLRYVFNNVIEMNTPYQKIFRQTVYLAAKGADFYKNHENVIMGENINKFGEKPTEKFGGAFVADPTKLSNRNKIKANGKFINKFNNGNDFDYKRLYPSLLQEFNMAPNTQVGKIIIENSPYTDIPELKIDSGGSFIENLASYNFIEFCHRWLHMANIEQMLDDIHEYTINQNNQKRKVVYFKRKNRPIVFDQRPMPDWVKQEVDNHRRLVNF